MEAVPTWGKEKRACNQQAACGISAGNCLPGHTLFLSLIGSRRRWLCECWRGPRASSVGETRAGEPQTLPPAVGGNEMTYNKKYTFGLLHCSWHRAPNRPLEFPKQGDGNKGVLCYVNEMTVEGPFWMGLECCRPTPSLDGWNPQSHTLDPWEGRGAGG